MGWDHNGRYYTRSRRENGRVVREYVGGGRAGEMVAQLDAIERDKRDIQRGVARAALAGIAELDGPLVELNELAELLVKAAMLSAGFHQHNRGNWRKRRGNLNEDG